MKKQLKCIRKLWQACNSAIMQAKLKYSVATLPEQFFMCGLTFTPNFETILGDHFWSSSCPRSSKTGFFSKSLKPTLKTYWWLISATHMFLVTCRWLLSHHSPVEVQCCTQTVHSKLSDDGFLFTAKLHIKNRLKWLRKIWPVCNSIIMLWKLKYIATNLPEPLLSCGKALKANFETVFGENSCSGRDFF